MLEESAVLVLLVPVAGGAACDGSTGAGPAGAAAPCVATGVVTARVVVDVLVVVVQLAWETGAEAPVSVVWSVAVGLVHLVCVVVVVTGPEALVADTVSAVDVVG